MANGFLAQVTLLNQHGEHTWDFTNTAAFGATNLMTEELRRVITSDFNVDTVNQDFKMTSELASSQGQRAFSARRASELCQ